ncbi:HPr(Ser) kinase/phosphatase [Luteolibacter ambystomatis]|uniref:HPr kinase/phosphorylase n=2 Tax=Luteolibacter ambystomatis TaxID=2824561 RepID=A0A975G9G3_9BACT|nr:HPr(Ser) kinase/phosphatase [Luteolibacter ambystomatis]
MPPMSTPRVKTIASITVGEFFERHAEVLGLSLHGESHGFDRLISEPAINRPGLALAGFFSYFARKRIQVFGNSELAYLKKLPDPMRADRFRRICDRDIPCIVVARGATLGDDLMAVAKEHHIPVFGTSQVTMKFLNAATIRLEHDFGPSVTMHGCMVDMRGIGVMIVGKSGSGKSETAVGLLERGAALVADDMVRLKLVGGELIATAPDLSRGYMEIRGIGIINAANLYGLASIRPDKRLDLVVTLKPHADLNEVDRLGLQTKTFEILGQHIPHVEIPVAPGRDTARMVTIAALDQQLRRLGYNMADEFNQKLLNHMAGGF